MSKKNTTDKTYFKVLTNSSITFLENYINNASPTGFEWEGQRMWLDYLRPYIDDHFVDNYY